MRDHLAQPNRSLAAARDAVCDPARFMAHPWNVQDAWFALKEAQGHPISRDALSRLVPAHLTAASIAAETTVVRLSERTDADDQFARYRSDAIAKVRAMIARGIGPTGGDAA